MGVVKKIVGYIALAALIYFAPQIGMFIGPSFLGAAIGAVIVAAGMYLIQTYLLGGGRSPDIEAGKINVRISDPPRWINGGRARSGGGALFGEFDGAGRFWYIIVHSDEILHPGYQYFLDDEPVTLDGSGYVYQKEFRLKTNKAKDPAESDGQGRGYVRIWTTTYSETDPTPPRIAALDAAFPSKWTSDHRLVGTTFSVICMDALDVEHRYKIYRWRGPFGLGEPSVSIAGDWANMYDPRDPTQTLGDRTTYKASRNAEIVWAWFRTHKFGRNKPESSVNWDQIAARADICDQDVVGIEGTQKRYEAGVAIVDSKRRVDAEREILLAMDGQIVFDEDGKSWVRPGAWEEPTLSFSRNRDIMAMSSVEAQDGESETQGVIVNYMEPDANYTVQPSAAWINPLYYDPLTTPKFLTVDIQACQNHNQAMRLAKGIGMRSQPRHKIGPTVNLRGLQARHERIVTINYDNTFAGDYEIATPVELDGAGIFTGFGAVPVTASRWTLLPGEEQSKPVVDGSAGVVSFPAITGESVYFSDGAIKIDFPDIVREDATYVAEYILTSEITGDENDPWRPMSINVNAAVSGIVPDGDYTVRYRYVTSAGNGPAWEYATIAAVAPLPPPTLLTLVAQTTDTVTISARAPTSPAFEYIVFFAGLTTNFVDAVPITDQIVDAPGAVRQVQEINVVAGQRYYWAVAFSADDVPSDPTGPLSVNVGAFDFTSMPTGAALTRSGPGNYRNGTGVLTLAAVDVARFNYQYDTATSTWSLGGILVEAAATNLAVRSQDLTNASWIKSAATAPSATRLVENNTSATHHAEQSIAVTSGQAYCLSVEALEVSGSAKRYLGLLLPTAAFGANRFAKFDLATGSVTSLSAGVTAGMTAIGAGKWLCWIVATATATVTTTPRIHLLQTGTGTGFTYTGDAASSLDISNMQFEAGSAVTSRIITAGGTVTRAADVLALDWSTNRHVPDGAITARYTFSDLTTQDVAATVASGHSTVPTNLNRRTIRKVERV